MYVCILTKIKDEALQNHKPEIGNSTVDTDVIMPKIPAPNCLVEKSCLVIDTFNTFAYQ